MNKDQIFALFKETGAIVNHGHFVYASGRHGSTYIDKDVLYPKTRIVSQLCKEIALRFYTGNAIDTVIGPAMGGVILSNWVAYHLTMMQGHETAAIYAEKSATSSGFDIRPSFQVHVKNKRVLVVEDQLTTGASAAHVVQAVRNIHGNVIGLGAIWNRGGVTSGDLGRVPILKALIHRELDSWPAEDCPLCLCKSTVNTTLGHGKDFIDRQKQPC